MQLKQLLKQMILALIGGTIYVLIEMMWRGYSHVSMFLLGSICFIFLGSLNESFSWDLGMIWQMFMGANFITVCELITGIIVNIWLKLEVWDYSGLPFNFMGQICLAYYGAWVFLSGIGIVVDDYLRHWLFDEEKPHYKIF